jgi:hypothetical protein
MRSTMMAFLIVTGVLAVACGQDDATNDGADGENKARELNEAGACGAAASWKTACASKSAVACDDTIVSACSDVTSLLNNTILDAAKTCISDASGAGKCDGSPTSCLAKAVTSAKPSDAHKKLAKGFCECLPVGGDACTAEIDNGSGAAQAALTIALPLSDAIADAITESCTTTMGCSATFSACAQGVITKKIAEKVSVEAAGCVAKSILSAAKDASNNRGGAGSDSEPAGPSSNPSCKAKTCEDYPGKCGEQDNGCGGKVRCAVCPSSCVPAKCGSDKPCGTFRDGCGGVMNCGQCGSGTCTDRYEPNQFALTAKSLGDATDAPNTTFVMNDLTLSDGDEDWFKMHISDSGFGGNPQISAAVTESGIEVSVFHDCDSKPNYSTCTTNDGVSRNEPGVGAGCVNIASNKATLSTECAGLNETGTTYVRLRKVSSTGQCLPYTVTIEVF